MQPTMQLTFLINYSRNPLIGFTIIPDVLEEFSRNIPNLRKNSISLSTNLYSKKLDA